LRIITCATAGNAAPANRATLERDEEKCARFSARIPL
jgi:hypothetical protein